VNAYANIHRLKLLRQQQYQWIRAYPPFVARLHCILVGFTLDEYLTFHSQLYGRVCAVFSVWRTLQCRAYPVVGNSGALERGGQQAAQTCGQDSQAPLELRYGTDSLPQIESSQKSSGPEADGPAPGAAKGCGCLCGKLLRGHWLPARRHDPGQLRVDCHPSTVASYEDIDEFIVAAIVLALVLFTGSGMTGDHGEIARTVRPDV
jgi:hypothetical protein